MSRDTSGAPSDTKPDRSSPVVADGGEGDYTMRSSVVHPTLTAEVADVELTGSTRGRTPDDADGFDPLTAESFAPLLSTNQYLVRKMASQALMDVALMMANISQLRTLVYGGPEGMEYYYVLLTLVGFSLGAQIIFAVLIFVIWVRESDQHQRQEYYRVRNAECFETPKHNAANNPDERARLSTLNRDEEFRTQRLTNHLNYITMVLVFIITVVNMFITGFGIKLEPSIKKPSVS
ncbi:unnamed protein product [Lymnaea stagnalis]|uniref:Ninjurin-1 n=1 Tax=Lymnaea stagnalis TaxID=6523 RepID=A0AAV2GXQ5_LYMST